MYGSRIRDLRKANSYTQENLALRLNISPKTIGSWEREERMPPADKLSTLADLFGVTVDYLLGRTNDKHEEVLAAAHLDKGLKDMTPEQRKAVYDFIEFQKKRIDREEDGHKG